MTWYGMEINVNQNLSIFHKKKGGGGANVEARFNSIIFLKKEKYSKQALHGHV